MEKKKINFLIVEDEALIAQWLKMELELLGYEVCGSVPSGEEAVISAMELRPDVILMDISLSGRIDGIEAAKQILSDREVVIIFMTGYNEEIFHEELIKLKPLATFSKPVQPQEVKAVIDNLFK
jgi:two-component system, response regulator PdtaR